MKLEEPLEHEQFAKRIAGCYAILTDSGGIQEEASFLGKRIFCCRKITERTELIDDYITYTPTPESLKLLFKPKTDLLKCSNIYGEGKAHLKINFFLKNTLYPVV